MNSNYVIKLINHVTQIALSALFKRKTNIPNT